MAEAASNEKKPMVKPEKPDEEVYKARLKKAEKEHADSKLELNEIKSKIDSALPSSTDSSISKAREALLNELKDIREKQSRGKNDRSKILQQIKKEDAIVKDMISQQKSARSRIDFKSIEDLDREISRLDKSINTGTMKIVDERKALDTISLLNKQRKKFSIFDESQKAIDAKKNAIKQLRDQLDDPESKALSEKSNKIQSELDAIKAQQDDIYKNINNLRDERKRLQDNQQAKYMAVKEIKDNYYEQCRAVQKWEYEARQRIRDKKKADEIKYQQEKKKARAQQILAEASDKAFLEEIRRAHSLLRFLDPSYSSEKAPPLHAPSNLHAIPQRQVNGPEIKGVRISKKVEEDYFTGTGGKKGKKAKKIATKDNSTVSKYSCPPAVMEDCAFIGIDPPMSVQDIQIVKEKLLSKLEYWKANQDAETEKNIAKAREELERLEAEESKCLSPTPESTSNEGGNRETKANPLDDSNAKNQTPHHNGQSEIVTSMKTVPVVE
ncbi:Uncharacterized protein GcM3_185020 [Golovinomyces cichoracearum]|uniref:Nuclear segregation protein n=1 Tax=Golovinomyces cichoracearum TaxID=62708 RepID=A0A420HK72_9PEZI|nr:Uncharacterized protein GcM3_185020 [Golovinomyces cichoracearum]